MENKDTNKPREGVYLSNFVATAMSLFILVLAFASGFFAQAYFKGTGVAGTPAGTTAGGTQPETPTVTLAQVKSTFDKAYVKFGPSNRKVIFVEASDPSCPFCQIAAGKNSELNNQVGDRFKLVKDGGTYQAPVEEMKKLVDAGKASYALIYRNGHGNGEMGMKALYCAFDQGKFWPASDLLMSAAGYKLLNETVKNDKAKSGDLAAFLASAVNQSQLKQCLDSGKYDNRIAEDTKLGDGLGVNGTPGFFVNEKSYAGAYSFADMQSTVDAALK